MQQLNCRSGARGPLRIAAGCSPRPRRAHAFSPNPFNPSLSSLATSPLRPGRLSRSTGLQSRLIPAGLPDPLAVGLFFAPGFAALVYAYFRGKGNLTDGLSRLLTEISQGYFQPDVGGKNIPVAQGELSDLAGDQPLFKALYQWFIESGGVYKLVFGPKAFIVVSDPVVVRHLLKDNAFNYDKGVLAEILEPIMGRGLIPADLDTWRVRRRAVVPAFHRQYYDAMVTMFGRCADRSSDKLQALVEKGQVGLGGRVVDMESEFLSLGLDIIGLGVFNYDFGSITSESPVIKAVYGVLKEAEHRSTFYLPYWNLPLADVLVPRQAKFRRDLRVINDCLDDLIRKAQETRVEEDAEALQNRDYSKLRDPSLLRFLVDMRGEDVTNKQLRDDLMTMLIAGHETTAAVLTWALYCLMQSPAALERVLREVDGVERGGNPQGETVADLEACKGDPLGESLRMYPQPPILIRRALGEDVLPGGLRGDPAGYPIGTGADLFISVWNLHRSPYLWKDPDTFRPDRFFESYSNPDFEGKWAGAYAVSGGAALYPNEVGSDFAFIPFGGGARKCVGDQFAMFEATVALAVLLRRFSFALEGPPEKVGMATGATIHTANGLMVRVSRRTPPPPPPAPAAGSPREEQLPRQPVAA
ncbi:hypothetical protein VOLCADRAFT_65884 [Volvox carteri f. nagariensis]|uniref:Cytochrome P450 n=1 Tax=Volvox carteri f. nagariensis TaxID=3068 RepID=D8U9X3_VOLCA|nr:uncharacterized protein VOLCADRAFT_65884 [Volvox carteri f. nagariensis]EFJ43549.1 hypothetical protein VOLCADRAFT_65884 [Volvox carteri f. nagariensis]|eukprot:XP_002955478.1 hypothetical protein VOLCADRAFT_65884 [Volvox carteri f. nagariensis]